MSREPAPRAAFDDALRTLDAPALAALVADLWAARGYQTRREGNRVVVGRDSGAQTVHVHDGAGRLRRVRRPPAPADVDADLVVTNVAATADGVVDAADLRDALLYAVPPSTGDALCRQHLGIPARCEPAPTTGSGLRTVAVVALVALVAVSGLTLATGVPSGFGTATESDPSVGDVEDDAAEVETPDRPSPTDAEVAPGVAPDGSIDVDRLAAAHASVLADVSYVWVGTYREYHGGTLVSTVRWRVVVEGPDRYNATVTGGETNGSVAAVVGTTAYADGELRYERAPDGAVTRERIDTATAADDPYVEAATRLISWYLSVGDASVGQAGRADDGRHYVFAEGDPWTGTEDERTVAVVRDYGLVDSLHRSHRLAGTNTTVVVDFEYRDTGATTVTEPAWVRNATAGGPERTGHTDRNGFDGRPALVGSRPGAVPSRPVRRAYASATR